MEIFVQIDITYVGRGFITRFYFHWDIFYFYGETDVMI